MSKTIKLIRSAVPGRIPTISSIELGQIALNTYDGKAFIKKNDGVEQIVQFVTTDSVITGSIEISGSLIINGTDFDFFSASVAAGSSSLWDLNPDGSINRNGIVRINEASTTAFEVRPHADSGSVFRVDMAGVSSGSRIYLFNEFGSGLTIASRVIENQIEFRGYNLPLKFYTNDGQIILGNDDLLHNTIISGNLDIRGSGSVAGDFDVAGILTAQEFHTSLVSSSVIYSSGSTKFGDSGDDIHQFTGSIRQSGSYNYFLGNVGVGTNNPGVYLSFFYSADDNAQVKIESDASGALLYLDRQTADDAYLTVYQTNNTTEWGVGNSGDSTSKFFIVDYSNGNTPIVLEPGLSSSLLYLIDGNVGIGTVLPQTKLHIWGDVSASNFYGTASYATNTLTASYSSTASYLIDQTSGLWTGSDDYISRLGDVKISGSLDVSGSLSLLVGSTINDISNDTSLGDDSITTIVTEHAVKTYVDDQVILAASGSVFGSGSSGYLARWKSSSSLENSLIYDNNTFIGIGTENPQTELHIWNNVSASNFYGNAQLKTLNVSLTGSFKYITITKDILSSGIITASAFYGDGVNIIGIISSSYAISGSYSITSSFANNAITASYVESSSFANNAISSSYAITASYSANALTDPNVELSASIWKNDGTNVWVSDTIDNVGIGTINPQEQLHVWNNISASNIFISSASIINNVDVGGNMTINGILTAQEFHTEFVSASIIYSSGSTKFGDTLDDTHQFTGSVYITGSLTLNGTLNATASWANNTISASWASTASYAINAITDPNVELSASLWKTDGMSVWGGTSYNVGIGTTVPKEELHVWNNISASAYYGDGSNLENIIAAVTSSYPWNVSSSAYIYPSYISSSVGIGTIPNYPFHVYSSGSTILSIEGSQGTLFQVRDSFVGTLFEVNDISGIPILEVKDTDTVSMGTYGKNTLYVTGSYVGIGISTPGTIKLKVSGSGIDNLLQIGDDYMFVSGNGRIGFGTTTPNATLQIVHNAGDDYLNAGVVTINSNGVIVTSTNIMLTGVSTGGIYNSYFRPQSAILNTFFTSYGNDVLLTLSQDGRIGIGTALPFTGSNSGSLHVWNDVSASTYYGDGSNLTNLTASNLPNWVAESASLWKGDGTNVWVSDTSDNVGIGTTDPTQKLHVSGNVLFDIGTNSARYLYMGNTTKWLSSNGDWIELRNIENNQDIYISSANDIKLNAARVSNVGIIRFQINSNNVMIVTGSLVGIGTTLPQVIADSLHVWANISASAFYGDGSNLTNITASDLPEDIESSASLWKGDGTNVWVSDTSDNVGVGLTNPERKFVVSISEIGDGIVINSTANYSPGFTLKNELYEATASIGLAANQGHFSTHAKPRDLILRTVSGSIIFANGVGGSNNPALMYISASTGFVGIGTTNPESSLDVQDGYIVVNNEQGYRIRTASGTALWALSATSADILQIGSENWDDLIFYVGGTTARMFMDGATGNIGINNITPQEKLHVAGNVIITGSLQIEATSSLSGGIFVKGDSNFDGNVNIDGILTADEFHTTLISSSIIYSSGSTKFGDTLDDIHQFTGSVYITGSLIASAFYGDGSNLTNITASDLPEDIESSASLWKGDGTNVWVSDINDNVGIGTAEPVTDLHIWGAISSSGVSSSGDGTFDGVVTADHFIFAGYGTMLQQETSLVYLVNNYGGNGGLGLYSGNDLPITLLPNSIAMLTVSESGIGIGTTNPQNTLHVFDPSQNKYGLQVAFNTTTVGDWGGIVFNHDWYTTGHSAAIRVEDVNGGLSKLSFWNNNNGGQTSSGSLAMIINQYNNIGIGTSNPKENLHVWTNISASAFYGDGSNLTNITASDLPDWVADSASIWKTNGTQIWASNTGSYVGIGLENPTATLEVSGNIRGRAYIQAGIALGSAGASNRYIGNGFTTNDFWYNVPGSGQHRFAVNDVEIGIIDVSGIQADGYLHIDGAADSYLLGDVGIGTNSPQENLHVWGNVSSSKAYFSNGDLTYGTTSAISLEVGTDTIRPGAIKLFGSTDASIIQQSTDNLHIDTLSGRIYLGYYGGNGTYFGDGNGIRAAYMDTAGQLWVGNGTYQYWHENNDGHTSGLDADLLDGLHSSSFLAVDGLAVSSSFALIAETASYAITASYSANALTDPNVELSASIWESSQSYSWLKDTTQEISVGTSGSQIDAKLHVYSTTTGSRVFLVEGQNGALFQVLDELSGSLFGVSDISGLPILEVFDDDRVVLGKYNANTLVVTGSVVGIGTNVPTVGTGALHVWNEISASAYYGDGSNLSGIISGYWTGSGVNIYRSSDVGIGNVPSYKLHVIAGSGGTTLADFSAGNFLAIQNSTDTNNNTSRIRFINSNDTAIAQIGAQFIDAAAALGSKLFFNVQNTGGSAVNAMIIDENGYVGIGTDPENDLHIASSGTPIINMEDTSINRHGSIAVVSNRLGTGRHVFEIGAPSGETDMAFVIRLAGDSTRLVVSASGLVGIGTANPVEKLHVHGDIYTSTNLHVTNTIYLGGRDNDTYIDFRAGDNIDMYAGGVLGLTVEDGGNVGIGTANPLGGVGVLHVWSNVSASAFYGDGSNLTGIIADNAYWTASGDYISRDSDVQITGSLYVNFDDKNIDFSTDNKNQISSLKTFVIGSNHSSTGPNAINSIIFGYSNKVYNVQTGIVFANTTTVSGTFTNVIYEPIVLGGSDHSILSTGGSVTTPVIIGGYQSMISGSSSNIYRSTIISGFRSGIDNSRRSTLIGGYYSHIKGTASGSSILGGFRNLIYSGSDSAIIGGKYLIASGSNQVVLGRYNVPDETSFFIIGSGSDASRKNIFTVGQDGDTITNGYVSASAYYGDTMEISEDLINAGITWTTQQAIPGFNSIAYGNNKFVAVSYSSASVMISQDGIMWKSHSISQDFWYDITYGNGLFVAVAGDGADRIMTSPNGITWASQSSPEPTDAWISVTYGNGLFASVSTNGSVMTSPDGETWTTQSAAEANSWRGITYGNGLFVAVAITGNRIMTSPDGITWTSQSAAEANSWRDVTYGNGLFVAVSYDGTNRVMTSPDGETWTSQSVEQTAWLKVTYGNGLFVAGSQTGTNRIMTSPNGETWTTRSYTEGFAGITYGNGKFITVGDATKTSGKINDNIVPHNNIYQGGMNIFGDVGMGTNSPEAQLHVWENVSASAYYGDGSNLTGISAGYWTGSDAGITRDSAVQITGSLSMIGDAYISGTLFANAKSFDIPHPTKKGKRLRYGSLEGNEYGIYYRGESNNYEIELPDYWYKLIDEKTITVQLTSIGRHQNLYVYDINSHIITIRNAKWFNKRKPHFYFTIYAERCDISKLKVEY